jgi:hypothetical protein
MKQFHDKGDRTFCIMAALFLALSPLFHGLHLASRHHPHRFCNPIRSGRALYVHLCCHGHECESGRAESWRVAISNSQVNEGYTHDPSTCPICQTFAQLVKDQLLPFSQVAITPQNIQLKEPKHDQAFTDRPSFLSGYPRAPPAC